MAVIGDADLGRWVREKVSAIPRGYTHLSWWESRGIFCLSPYEDGGQIIGSDAGQTVRIVERKQTYVNAATIAASEHCGVRECVARTVALGHCRDEHKAYWLPMCKDHANPNDLWLREPS